MSIRAIDLIWAVIWDLDFFITEQIHDGSQPLQEGDV